MEAEEARKKLDGLRIEFSSDRFFQSLRKGDSEVAKLFLDAGQSPDARDPKGRAAVVTARKAGHREIGKLLLARGASPEPLLAGERRGKDWWEKITAISAFLTPVAGLLIAVAGFYFTNSYNNRQLKLSQDQAQRDSGVKEQNNKVLELEAIQKLIPFLVKDDNGRAAALAAIDEVLSEKVATRLAKSFKGVGSVQYLRQAVVSDKPGAKQAAITALSSIAASGGGADSQLATQTLSLERVRSSVVRLEIRTAGAAVYGSGLIVTDDGYVLTSAQVGQQAAYRPMEATVSGKKMPAKLVVGGVDERADLALVKIEGRFSSIALAKTGPPVGMQVFGLGYAIEVADPITYAGTVSSVQGDFLSLTPAFPFTLSGGPLVSSDGQIIGLMTSVRRSGALAVPSDVAQRFLTGRSPVGRR